MSQIRQLLLMGLLSLPFHAANAVVIYEQLTGNFGDRISSYVDNLGNSNGIRVADDFVLADDALIHDIHWWGYHNEFYSSGLNDFTFTFYTDNAGSPGAVLHMTTGSLDVEPDLVFGTYVDFYSSILADDFIAKAETTYWLSIFNAGMGASWLWNGAAGSSVAAYEPPGDNWSDNSFPGVAFQLTTAEVHEPTTLALITLGLIWLGVAQYKKKT